MTPRIHVLCAAEQKEHAGCYAELLVLKVYQKSDKDLLFRSNTVLSRMLYDAALVARLCWEEFVHEMTTVTFDVVRHNAIQDRTCRREFYPPHTTSQDFFVHEPIEIVITQRFG